MNPPKCDDLDYIHFLIAAQKLHRSQPKSGEAPAHGAFTRLLQRPPPDTAALWHEAQGLADKTRGVLVLDDTTLDKPYARKMALVTRHGSGKHHRVVPGINLLTVLWTDGHALIPCDFRVYDTPWGGKTKNAHVRDMLQQAQARGFHPASILCDRWYASKAQRHKGFAVKTTSTPLSTHHCTQHPLYFMKTN